MGSFWTSFVQAQLRLEATMQSKIRVYESGRSEQVCSPPLVFVVTSGFPTDVLGLSIVFDATYRKYLLL